jgi:phage-related minor tail protein
MTEYNILARVKIDGTEADAYFKKPRNLTVKVDGGTSANELGKLNTTVGTLQNKLERLKISNVDAFRSQPILDQYTNMQNLVGAYSRGETSLGNVNMEMGRFENNIKKSNEGIRTTTTSVDGLGTALGKAISKIALWAVATTAIYGSLKQLQEGTQYVKDLNKLMTDTQIVTGYTKAEIASLATQYNDLAIEVSATTLEVATGALEWQRQGKTVEETNQLLKASVMMAKLANMDQASSTEALTSIINGYQLSIEEVMPAIDRLISLDNNFATSTQEIADALTKVSAVSKQSNVSLEEMAAMITVVSSDTRIAAESIGQSFSR